MASKKDEVRRHLADLLIAKLEEGKIPWESDLKKGGKVPSTQYNGVSKRAYSGSNWFFLLMTAQERGYQDPRWFTFKQASDNNYRVRKGEKGTPIEFFRIYDRVTKKDLDGRWYNTLTKEEKKELWDSGRLSMIVKYSYVFNAHQLDGIELLPEINAERVEPSEVVKQLSRNMNVPIFYDQTKRSFYTPARDEIHVPTSEWFVNERVFNSVQMHEIAHATGHSSRMDRDMSGTFGTAEYAKEELRAEIASMFLARQVAIEYDDMHMVNHAAYVQSWIRLLKDDPNALFTAIKDAEKINDYMIQHLDQDLQQKLNGAEEKKPDQPAEKVAPIDITDEPTVTILWSEHSRFKGEETMSLCDANALLGTLDYTAHAQHYGYYKTCFRIDYVMNGQPETYEGRQDLGDGEGSLIRHIENYHTYYENAEEWDEYLLATGGQEALEADKALRKKMMHEFIPYLKMHNEISILEYDAEEMAEEGLNPVVSGAYHAAVKEYAAQCRAMLNKGIYQLPPAPELETYQALAETVPDVDELQDEEEPFGHTICL